MKKTFILLLLIILSFRSIAQNIDLSLHLRLGSTYYTNNTISSSIVQNQQGKDVNFDAHIVVKTAYKILKIMDTVYSVEVRYKKLSLKINTAKGQASYSSVNAAKNDETSQLLAALIDRPFLIRLSNTGKVLSVENIDEIANNLLAKISGSDQQQKRAAEDTGDEIFW